MADVAGLAGVSPQTVSRVVLFERGEKMGQTPHDGAPAGA
jgi:hypothetical protein